VLSRDFIIAINCACTYPIRADLLPLDPRYKPVVAPLRATLPYLLEGREQRVWHQEIGHPKTEGSRRILGMADLADRYREKAVADNATPWSFVFQQRRAPGKPLWDSGVRDALHQAAAAENCDFPGLGPHSFRRANITCRQQVGGSAIEASKIAGHSDLEMTGEYTFVEPERQNELTRRIQEKLAEAAKKRNSKSALLHDETASSADAPPSLADTKPVTPVLQ
jgi:Phage integrase family